MDELASVLHLPSVPEVKVETIPNTELIKISVESPDPTVARNSANTLAEILIRKGKELYTGGGESMQEILGEQLSQAEADLNEARQDLEAFIAENPGDTSRIDAMNEAIQLKENTYASLLTQYDEARLREVIRANTITVVEPAVLPATPSKPNKVLNLGLGVLVGLAGGVGLAFLFESLGPRLYTSRQIEAAAELSPIGKIPSRERKGLLNGKKRELEHQHTPFKEAFRRLQVQICMQNTNHPERNPLKVLMITSAEPGEGKSTITTQLAIALAQSGKKVIVVDCDFHIPKQHKLHEMSNIVGLSTVLSHQANIAEAMQVTRFPGLHVLTSGPLPPNPAKLLGTPLMKSMVVWLSQQYDLVLLDTPALLAVADTALLASVVDGVVFVARRNHTREDSVREACRQLVDLQAPMIGLVVNEAERNGTYYYYRHR
jgi:non-specific protein-tyrosine kinase